MDNDCVIGVETLVSVGINLVAIDFDVCIEYCNNITIDFDQTRIFI